MNHFLKPKTAMTKLASYSATGKAISRFAAALIVISGSIAHADGPGKTLAVYGDAAVAKTPTPGWSFLWNASGKVGDAKGYSPLTYVEKAKTSTARPRRWYGVMDENGALKPDAPSHEINIDNSALDISAMRDKDGIARFYIASYTLAENPAGEVWINNGNLRNQAFPEGTALQIYVNDELKSQSLCKQGRFATVFQENLGRLKKGDAIRVAIGPSEKSLKGGGRLLYTIEEYPAGEKPAAPIPIITPPLDAVIPQLGVDGKIKGNRVDADGKIIVLGYAEKHQAQCKDLLANNPELVFIGDSHTARWPAELLQEKFEAFRPANLGIGGDGIQNVLWRLQNGVLDQIHPKVIVLLIGANNITIFTPDQIAEGIATVLKAIQEKAPSSKILLLGILPNREWIKGLNNEKIRQTNANLALLADNKRIFYLEFGDKLVEPDGSITREIMPDIHLALPGYTRWMDTMKPTLDKLLNE
jgi:lysophospholipase L1-like esterase